jgi:hypothetical protein
VNDNFRDLARLPYNQMIPAPVTVHVRHYLFMKPDYLLIWDVFERSHGPATLRFTPAQPVEQVSPMMFRSGAAPDPHLLIHILAPEAPEVVENRPVGPWHTLALRAAAGQSFMSLLVPQRHDRAIRARVDAGGRIVMVDGAGVHDVIRLPPPGSADRLPTL